MAEPAMSRSPAAAPAASPLRHLMPGWFAIVMGACGLALAWHRAAPTMGEPASIAAIVIATAAACVFAGLVVLSALRAARHGDALREDLAHPVRHAFVAAVPISMILLATLAVALFGPGVPGAALLWWLGAIGQLLTTLWVLSRWLRPPPLGVQWAAMTPALFIPVVGNVLVPLAGVGLGYPQWSAAQFGVGLLFWPIVAVLILVRLGTLGPLPERLLPTMAIHIAPPAIVGVAALQFDAPPLLAWMAWGVAMFVAAWVATLARRIVALPFSVPHWATSFPLAALTVLTLRLSRLPDGGWLQGPALVLLAGVTLVVLWLSLGTWRGLRQGTLLVPEPSPPAGPAAGGTVSTVAAPTPRASTSSPSAGS
jgi:tellurite resistance protein